MRAFATLINALDSTNKTSLKLEAIDRFLHEADNTDKLWFLALFTGKRPKRNVNTALMKQWTIEVAAIPEWLFQESYAAVGDLGETIALVLPQARHYIDRTLTEWMNRIIALKDSSEAEKKEFVLQAWNNLPTTERFIFNKLLGGSFRLGVSSKTLINALAKHYQMDASAVAHSVMGDWKMGEVTFDDLIKGHYTDTQLSKPYPFCLAYLLEKELNELGDVQDWQIEYKWDGIRGQFIKRGEEVFIWSRGEELVTDQFPEIRDILLQWQGNFVIDGEILVVKEQEVMNFSALQKRLNRKTISKKLLEEFPIQVYAYDLIEWEGEDWRHKSMLERRQQLESLFLLNPSPHLQLSTVI